MHLGILASHPIQYQAPWFRALAERVDLQVFFAHRQTPQGQADGGFGVAFDWDVDLLSGYKHRFLANVSRRPSTNHFSACDTPEIANIIRLPSAPSASSALRSPLSALPSPQPFDAFIVSGWQLKCYWQAVRACRRAGVPVLVRGDSQLLTPRSSLKRLLKYFTYRLVLRYFDGFLVVGQRNREYLRHYDVPEKKLFFAPHFVDNEWFKKEAEKLKAEGSGIRRRWGIPEDAFCVLFCGKFIPKKRPQDLVAAAQLLSASSPLSTLHSPLSLPPKLHLLFVGSGELGNDLRNSCHVVFDAENSVVSSPVVGSPVVRGPVATFAGFLNQSEIPKAYVAADCLALPSASETWGLAVNEAMACGLPAVVSDAVGCAPDLIEEGKTGFTYPVGDTSQLSQRFAGILAMKQNGYDFGPALEAKLLTYSLGAAVGGTLRAVEVLIARDVK